MLFALAPTPNFPTAKSSCQSLFSSIGKDSNPLLTMHSWISNSATGMNNRAPSARLARGASEADVAI